MRRSFIGLVLPAAISMLLAGCGDDGPTGNGGTPPATASVNVGNVFFQSVHNGSMNPGVDTVATGGTVTWTWTAAGSHSVRFDDPGLGEGPVFSDNGSVYSKSFPAAGTYTYDCGIHGPQMTGTIVVK